MKKILFVLCFSFIYSSCVTITQYSGEIYPSSVAFNSANFKYIKSIKGSSEATYGYNGWDEKKIDGLVNQAKSNMYNIHYLLPNQVITNVTLDIIKEGTPNNQYKTIITRKVRVVITADVFEFAKNGIYLSETNIINDNDNDNANMTHINELNNQDLIDYYQTDKSYKFFKGDDVIYNVDNKFYKGSIIEKSSTPQVNVSNIYEKIKGKWILKIDNATNTPVSKSINKSDIRYVK